MTKFKLPVDVTLKMDGSTVSFSRGVINYQELNIDQKQSNSLLIEALKRLSSQEEIEASDDEVVNDLSTLVKMGYVEKVQVKVPYSKILFIVDDNELDYYTLNLPEDVAVISATKLSDDSNFSDLDGIHDLDTNRCLFESISEEFELAKFDHIFWVDTYYHVERIRIFNCLLKYLNKVGTFSISDYSLFFVTTVEHGETGCFECLENQIKTKMRDASILNSNYSEKKDNVSLGEQALKFGFTCSVMESLVEQGSTNTLGNVVEFDNQTMEYYFDSNRIQTSCSICETQNNVFHEEQNLNTIKLLDSLKR